jgi:RNase P/RNase MRP subunit p29
VAILAQTRDTLTYRAASTQAVVLVEDDPNALFEIRQVAGGTPLTANDVGLNANIVVGSGSTYTGFSGMALDNTTEATTNTLDVKIMEIVNRADNDPGSAVGTGADSSTFLVRLNRHRYANQIAGI